MGLILKYADGTPNMFPHTGTYPETDVWVPGCTIHAGTLSGHGYVIDIDTGIATNVTGRGRRAW